LCFVFISYNEHFVLKKKDHTPEKSWFHITPLPPTVEERWPHGECAGLVNEQNRFEPWPGALGCVSWARHFTLTVPLSTQVYKWVPARGHPVMD